MSEPNPIYSQSRAGFNKDIKETLASWLLSLPHREGDLVRTTYTEPPSDRKIEELETSSASPSGVRVQLEGVRTAAGTELWLDSGWIKPIELKEPLPYVVGDLVNYSGGKTPEV